MNIYVCNLGDNVTNESLDAIFSTYGAVSSSKVIKDLVTGNSRGFGFVEMDDEKEGEKAISKINGTVLDGRKVAAKIANERPEKKGSLIERLRGY